jgi:CRP-like cAMP-binding protein
MLPRHTDIRTPQFAPREDSIARATLLRAAGARRRISRGGAVYRFGDTADPLYVVDTGLVKLTVCSPTGRDLTIGLYGPGEIFGEEAVFEAGERVSDAVAVEACSLVAVARGRVHEMLERDPAVSAFLTRLLATRVRESVRQIEKMAWSPVPARLAEALLRLASRAGVSDAAGTRVDLRITHQELANARDDDGDLERLSAPRPHRVRSPPNRAPASRCPDEPLGAQRVRRRENSALPRGGPIPTA